MKSPAMSAAQGKCCTNWVGAPPTVPGAVQVFRSFCFGCSTKHRFAKPCRTKQANPLRRRTLLLGAWALHWQDREQGKKHSGLPGVPQGLFQAGPFYPLLNKALVLLISWSVLCCTVNGKACNSLTNSMTDILSLPNVSHQANRCFWQINWP